MAGLYDEIEATADVAELVRVRSELVRTRYQRDQANSVAARLSAEVDGLKRTLGFVDLAEGTRLEPPKWLSPAPSSRAKHATLVLLLSDLHFDEVVRPEEIGGLNAYNRRIAELRLKAWAENAVKIARHYLSGVTYDGVALMLSGDIFSGDIHEELTQTNEDTILGSLLHWSEQLGAAVELLAAEFGKVHISAVPGNHGRLTRKPRAKLRARTNLDWLLARMLERHYAKDKRLTFQIGDDADTLINIYGRGHLLTHGDQVNGGSGIGGIWPPIMRMRARKAQRAMSIGAPFDTLWMGHWHQLIQTPSLVVNGCFPSSSKVTTSTGCRLISDIEIGDLVMSRDGSEQKVTSTYEQKADRLVGLKVYGLPETLFATPNHLVWARKGSSLIAPPSRRHLIETKVGPSQWIPIDFLSPGDYVHVPFPHGNERPVDAETAWAYGLYIAEGNALMDGGRSKKHHRVCLTMHSRERATVDRWAAWFERTFGKRPTVGHRSGRNTTDLYVSAGREVSLWFRETFGHGAGEKHLPDGALYWADDLKAALLDGWIEGDGHVHQMKDCRPEISATTISLRLAWEMFHIAPTSGRLPSLHRLAAGGPRKNDSHAVHLTMGQNAYTEDGEVFYRVAERYERDTDETVHDLEVSGEHTYTVAGVGVHNSMKGTDEYAWINNFGHEVPQQALAVVTPEHGVSLQAPVFCQNRKLEKW